jgi:hypothetical protein
MRTFPSVIRLLTLLLFSSFAPLPVSAQFQLEGLAANWSDAIHEWTIYTAEGEEGNMRATWHWRDDFSQWNYRIGENAGDIRLKWKDNPEEWELRGDNQIVSARTRWRGDRREWRITDNDVTLILRTRWGNTLDEWVVESREHGGFYMYTVYAGDPRDWFIEDTLEEEVSLPMKVMLTFLVMFNSTF